MKKKWSIFLIVTVLVFITGFLFTLFKYHSNPEVDLAAVEGARLINLSDKSERMLTKSEAKELAIQLSRELPKNNETSSRTEFNTMKKNSPSYKVYFLNKDNKTEGIYELSLISPRYAKVIEGKVDFWEDDIYPITDYSFEELLK